jgi:FlaA1/EpsC-like NDP-sugar epimerase
MFSFFPVSPRWFIFALDFLVCLGSWIFVLQNWIFFHGILANESVLSYSLLPVLIVFPSLFYWFNLYSGIIRLTGFYEVKRILLISLIGTFFIYKVNKVFLPNEVTASVYMYIIYGFTILILLVSYRLTVKMVYRTAKLKGLKAYNIAIYGAGLSAVGVKTALENSTDKIYHIKAFIDDKFHNSNKNIEGIPIISVDEFKALHKKNKINVLIVSSLKETGNNRADIFDYCVNENIEIQKFLHTPPISPHKNPITNYPKINIEELLDRFPIQINKDFGVADYNKKRILITGAAGSIGSELAKQLVLFKPAQLILCDQAETPLYDLLLDLTVPENKDVLIVPFLGSVNDELRMNGLFENYKPEIVFHAAAYKHVPVMESFPTEALKINVLGSSKMADLAVKYQAAKFIMISTDKAVNPSNVMGASKRIAEIYIQSLSQEKKCKTAFITTRFGNVLGSNGSVVELFKKQIEAGGPVTITHPDIIRYFMTVSEACQLVLQAGMMGKGGEIFTFDMGKPVKILDLAKKMIHLSGKVPEKDIPIHFTGLRQGEKLFEELSYDNEKNIKTYHDKIFISKVPFMEYNQVFPRLGYMATLLRTGEDEELLIRWMKTFVPEFISNNSKFEKLDNPVSYFKESLG